MTANQSPVLTMSYGASRDTDRAISAGISYLASRQTDDGFWEDFCLPVGSSTGWVSALIGRLLVVTGDRQAKRLALSAACWLSQTGGQGRWAYNSLASPDADSTAWAALLFQSLEEAPAGGYKIDYDFMCAHQAESGGFSTYLAEDAWGYPHSCVTPVVMLALLGGDAMDDRAIKWLLSARTVSGVWNGYWWASAFYPTLMALTALRSRPDFANANGHVSSLLNAPELSTIHNVFDLSCATLMASIGGHDEKDIECFALQLCRFQQDDGKWPASRCLRLVPHWIDIDADSSCDGRPGELYADVNGLVTTAFAVAALSVAAGTGGWF